MPIRTSKFFIHGMILPCRSRINYFTGQRSSNISNFDMSYSIPTIDFSKYGLQVSEDDLTDSGLTEIGEEIYSAMSTAGFCYLTGHGIPWSRVDEMNEISEKFYSLALETKMQFSNGYATLVYDAIGKSKADTKQVDMYEGFRTGGDAYTNDDICWPDVPGMKECYTKFADTASKLMMRILRALAHGMILKDKDYFCEAHSLMNQKGNMSILKSIKYPPVVDDDPGSEHRVGEHTDISTLTFLFQDQMGGLQVRDVRNEIVDVKPVEGAIVVNIGDVMQEWSGKRLRATSHRVAPPADHEKRKQNRRSVAYFGQANGKIVMRELEFEDGIAEYKNKSDGHPLTIDEYMTKRAKRFFADFKDVES